MKRGEKQKQVLIIVALLIGGYLVAHNIGILSGAGFVTTSVSSITLNAQANTWSIVAVHSGLVSDQVTWGASKETFYGNTGYASDKPLTITETGYAQTCKYAKGSPSSPSIVYQWIYHNHLGDVLQATAQSTCAKDATVLYGSSAQIAVSPNSGYTLGGYDCYFKIKQGDMYDVTSQTQDYAVNLTVSSTDGQVASLLLAPNKSFGNFVTSSGTTLGSVQVTGGLASLDSNCAVYSYKWFHDAQANQDYFTDGVNSIIISEFETLLFNSQSLTAVKNSYDSVYKDGHINKVTLTNGGGFTGGYYTYTPETPTVNLQYLFTISGDWIKVVRPMGIPHLSEVSTAASTQDGANAEVSFKICNDATGGRSPFTVRLECSGFPAGVTSVDTLDPGACTTDTVTTVANCPQVDTAVSCSLTAQALGGTDTKQVSLTCKHPVNPTQCTTGKLYCNTDATKVQVCNSDGTFTDISTCECVYKNNIATCAGSNPCPDGQFWNSTAVACQDIPGPGGGINLPWIWIVIIGISGVIVYFAYTQYKKNKL